MARFVEGHQRGLATRPVDYPFSKEEYRDRLRRVQERMAAAGIDVLVLTSPESMCYLHGYAIRWYRAQSPVEWSAPVATVVRVDQAQPIHFDTSGEESALRHTSVIEDVRYLPDGSEDRYGRWEEDQGSRNSALQFIGRELRSAGWLPARVGLEMYSHVPSRAVSDATEAMFRDEGCVVVDGTAILRDVRRRKSPQEIAYIEEAAGIADAALGAFAQALAPGVSELELWGEMTRAMSAMGGEHGALHESVVVGSIAEGHMLSSRRRVQRGDYVYADPSGVVNRYHANTSRTYFVGSEPDPAAVELLRLAGGAFDVLCNVARVGTSFTEINRALREYFTECGIWDLRSWVGGYEMGLSFPPDWVGAFVFTIEEEEDPRLVEDGMVTNFESIFHFPLLDTVVFQEDGVRALSRLPRELLVVAV